MHQKFLVDEESTGLLVFTKSQKLGVALKKMATIFASLVAVIGITLGVAPAAHAGDYGCGGNQIDSYSISTTSSVVYGTLYLYYDSSTGENCAVAVSNSTGGYGVSKPMSVGLDECSQTTQQNSCTVLNHVSDSNNYEYYAGPVSLAAAGHCIGVEAQITYAGKTAGAVSTPASSHCG